jgi:hypothetical protein
MSRYNILSEEKELDTSNQVTNLGREYTFELKPI